MDDNSVDDPEEYSVETIRAKRKTKAGTYEYLIKWAGYPEEDNTWEPEIHLNCPELIQKFHQDEADRRRRLKAERSGSSSQMAGKRLRRETSNLSASTQASEETINDLFVDSDDDVDCNARKKNKTSDNKDPDHTTEQIKGFERGLAIEQILTASLGEDDKLYFFLKWQGRAEIEMVDADELEKKGSYELCRWYRERLYWERSNPNGS